jgi:DNA/RNA-binding domain of Phe-tRNA-synthetase-like protein
LGLIERSHASVACPAAGFTIAPGVFERFPGIQIHVAVAHGIDNARPRPDVEAAWREAWASAATAGGVYGNAQSHPRIKPWRDRFRALGVSGKEFPSSAEALLRRALKGAEPFTLNPLVDFYNTVSLRHFAPAGAFDLDDMSGGLELRITRSGDTFWSMDALEPLLVDPGEVAYADAACILTRHFVWRQARTGLVKPETRNVVLVAEILSELGPQVSQTVLADFGAGLRQRFGVKPVCLTVADAQQPKAVW